MSAHDQEAMQRTLDALGAQWREQSAPPGLSQRILAHVTPGRSRPWAWQGLIAVAAGLTAVALLVFPDLASTPTQPRLRAVDSSVIKAPSTAKLRAPGTIVAPRIPDAPKRPKISGGMETETQPPAPMEKEDVV